MLTALGNPVFIQVLSCRKREGIFVLTTYLKKNMHFMCHWNNHQSLNLNLETRQAGYSFFFFSSSRWNQTSVNVTAAFMLSHVQLFATPRTVACQVPLSMGLSHNNSGIRIIILGKNSGMGCHFLFQEGIFLTQGWNPHLLHCKACSWPLSHLGSPSVETEGYV